MESSQELPFATAPDELNHVLGLLQLEKDAEKSYFKTLLEVKSPRQRRASGLTWYPVSIKDTGYGRGDYPYIVVERHDDQPHQFHGGQNVRVFSNQDSKEKEEIQGTVHYVNRQEMKIICYGDEHPRWLDDGKVGIDVLFDQGSFREMERSVKEVRDASGDRLADLRDILLGYQPPTDTTAQILSLPGFNSSQKQAIEQAAAAREVSLVHGPPGTGKTTTLIGIMAELVSHREKLLVCAPSNAAVDLLTEKAAKAGINVVRIGHLSRIDQGVIPYTLDGKLESHSSAKQIKKLKKQAAELRRMASKYKRSFGKEERDQRKLIYREARAIAQQSVQLEDDLVADILARADVVTATLVGSANRVLKGIAFDTAIIDEAGQGLEPAAWIPICKAQKAILAGDPHQLPPTVKQPGKEQKQFAVSLLEKAISRQPTLSSLLQTQYRMHHRIMWMSNAWFYGGKLEAHSSVADRKLEECPVLEFIDTAGCGYEESQDPDSLSHKNDGERDVLQKHLAALADTLTVEHATCGIISPYKAQVKALQDDLSTADYAPLTLRINTVDSFQGQEQDVIYLSLVRSNGDGNIGFLKDYRRMNVAMTRAKMKLVIIGDSATIGQDPFYQAFLDYCEEHDSYATAWEWM